MTTLPPRDWRLSNEEFSVIKDIFERKDADQRTPEIVRNEIASLDRDIDTNLVEREDTWREAILILLQGRNFLARYIDDEERSIPEECYEAEEAEPVVPDPLEGKHVALYSPMPFVVKALLQSLSVCINPAARYKGYEKVADLLQAIQAGQVSGVIALHGKESHSILGTLRHDFKNLPGRTYEEAQRTLFPPCIDLAAPHHLIEIIRLIGSLQQGSYQEEAEHFDLTDALPSLGVRMTVPKRDLFVAIVDDEPKMAEGMKRILDAWPRITAQVIVQGKGLPAVPIEADIVLLDEMLADGMKGEQVLQWLQRQDFHGLVASTTGGSTPAHTRHHFQQKGVVETNRQAAEAFVRFMNGLLQLV